MSSEFTNFFGRETRQRRTFTDSMGRTIEFETQLYPAGAAAELLPSALDFLSGPVGAAAEVASSIAANGLAGAEIRAELIEHTFAALASHLREVGGAEWFQRVLSTTRRKHKDTWIKVTDEAYYSDMFTGEMMLQLRLVLWVLEVNYGPFSGAGAWISAQITQRIPSLLGLLGTWSSALGLTEASGSGSDSGELGAAAATPTP